MRAILLFVLLAATGCFHINYMTDKSPAPAPQSEAWHHGAVYGLVEASDPVDVPKICPDGYARIESQQSFVNGLVQCLTFGLYNPQEVAVTCAAARGAGK